MEGRLERPRKKPWFLSEMKIKCPPFLLKPLVQLRLVSVGIILFSLFTVFAGFAPMGILIIVGHSLPSDGPITFAEIGTAFWHYIGSLRETFSIATDAEILYAFSSSMVLSISYGFIAIFLFFRKAWARKWMMYLIAVGFVNGFTIGVLRSMSITTPTLSGLVMYILAMIESVSCMIIVAALIREMQWAKKGLDWLYGLLLFNIIVFSIIEKDIAGSPSVLVPVGIMIFLSRDASIRMFEKKQVVEASDG